MNTIFQWIVVVGVSSIYGCKPAVDEASLFSAEISYTALAPVKARLPKALQEMHMRITCQSGICDVHREIGQLRHGVVPDQPVYHQGLAVLTGDEREIGILPAKGKGSVWFVPFNPGKPIINLSSGDYRLRYTGACGGFSDMEDPSCCLSDNGTVIRYTSCAQQGCPGGEYCLGYTVVVNGKTQSVEDYSSGGVLVMAEEIRLLDPPGYDVNNQGLIFRVDSFH